MTHALERIPSHGDPDGPPAATLSDFAREHLIARKKAGRVTDDTIAAAQLHLERAIEYLGADRELGTVTVREVRE